MTFSLQYHIWQQFEGSVCVNICWENTFSLMNMKIQAVSTKQHYADAQERAWTRCSATSKLIHEVIRGEESLDSRRMKNSLSYFFFFLFFFWQTSSGNCDCVCFSLCVSCPLYSVDWQGSWYDWDRNVSAGSTPLLVDTSWGSVSSGTHLNVCVW